MIKLQTGISTDRDFIKAMKERGQNVSASFPAETLRDQLNELNEDILVSFDSTNETILKAVNTEKPAPEPVEEVTVTINVDGLDEGDVATGSIGDELLTEFPAEVTRIKDTTETLTVEADGYTTVEQPVDFDIDKTITATLEKNEDEPEEKDVYNFYINITNLEPDDEPVISFNNETYSKNELPIEVSYELTTDELPSVIDGGVLVTCDGYQENTYNFSYSEGTNEFVCNITLDKYVLGEV